MKELNLNELEEINGGGDGPTNWFYEIGKGIGHVAETVVDVVEVVVDASEKVLDLANDSKKFIQWYYQP